jgi:hypothetical protein
MLGRNIFLSIAHSCSRLDWPVYAKALRVFIHLGEETC